MVANVKSWQEARDQLRKWREDNERKGEEIMELWLTHLASNTSKLGDEKWMILEQVAVAALDIHNYNVAEDAILELKERFPNSDRVRSLQVLRLQALERYDEAVKGLETMIKKDDTNSGAYKRKIAILKSQGKNLEAIKELTEYLNKFMSDQEAWSELCDLYLTEGDFARAVFCAEELVLQNPHNFFVHQRLAEIRYTMGGIENLKFALNYYSQAFKLNGESMRALFGIFLCASSLVSNPRVVASEKKDFSKTLQWSVEEISDKYNKKCQQKDQVKMIQGIFGSLQITEK